LRAVQTMNGLVDSLDILIGRCTPPSFHYYNTTTNHSASHTKRTTTTTSSSNNTTIGSLPELKSRYEIEFILPPNNNNTVNDDDEKKGRRGRRKNRDDHNDKVALTLRSITITFPEYLRSNVNRWALTSFPSPFSHNLDHRGVVAEPTPQEVEAYQTANQLRDHAYLEFGRLLTIAGMKMPSTSSTLNSSSISAAVDSRPRRKEENQWTLSDHFLHELGIDPMTTTTTTEEGRGSGEYYESTQHHPSSTSPSSTSAFFGRSQSFPSFRGRTPTRSSPSSSPPPTYSHPQLHQQRTAFINSIPWNQFALDYENAYNDAYADFVTTKLNLYNVHTLEGRERREQLVSSICGRARIITMCRDGDGDGGDDTVERKSSRRQQQQQQQQQQHDGLFVDNTISVEDEKHVVDDEDDIDIVPDGLDVIAQLVAIRRLSLLLYDNFDHLQMERMGRMWERLVIVFTPPRRKIKKSRSAGGREGGEWSSSSIDNNGQVSSTNASSSLIRQMREDGTPTTVRRHHPGRKLTKWERRKRHREKMMPVSRGWMRHVANSLLGKKNDEEKKGGEVGITSDGEREDALRNTNTALDTAADEDGPTASSSTTTINEDNHTSSSSSSSASTYMETSSGSSGFKFSYGSTSDQSVGHVTAYIPIDFRDGELVRQLYTHVYDYFDNCCGHVGFLKYGADGDIRFSNNHF
jgi:hypothetical protein